MQLYVASLGLTAANAGAFEQQVAATAQLYLALGVDLRHLGLALCALVLAMVEVAPAIDAGAAGRLPTLAQALPSSWRDCCSTWSVAWGNVSEPALLMTTLPSPPSMRVPS